MLPGSDYAMEYVYYSVASLAEAEPDSISAVS